MSADGMSKTQQIDSTGLLRIRAKLVGISPLLMNCMSQDVLLGMRDKSGKKAKAATTVLTPAEEAEKKLYLDTAGYPHLPVENLFATLKGAGRQVRLDGKRQISTAKSTILPSLMTIDTVSLPIMLSKEPRRATWEADVKRGVNPNGGEAVVIVRPRFDDWSVAVEVTVFVNEITESAIRRLFDIAGSSVGLCDFRPARGGTYGRFRVDEWIVL